MLAIVEDIVVLVVCLIVAYMPSIVNMSTVTVNQPWYNKLKPKYTPPSVVFPIVWSILYFMIGIALFLAVRKTDDNVGLVSLFAVNLVFNGIWSPVFFNLGAFKVALAILCLLIVSILTIVWGFYVWSVGWVRVTGILLVLPYLAWCSFATVLNIGFLQNQRAVKASP